MKIKMESQSLQLAKWLINCRSALSFTMLVKISNFLSLFSQLFSLSLLDFSFLIYFIVIEFTFPGFFYIITLIILWIIVTLKRTVRKCLHLLKSFVNWKRISMHLTVGWDSFILVYYGHIRPTSLLIHKASYEA